MARLPNVRITINHGWYLAPRGSMGSEALAYLPAYNAEVRSYYEDKGFVLLSEIRGDPFGPGGAVAIAPPSDTSIRYALARMEERVAADLQEVNEKEAEAKEVLKDNLAEASERRVWRAKLRGLEKRRQEIKNGRPTFAEMKRFFLEEYRLRIAAAQSREVRRTMALHAEEQQVAAEIALLEHDERKKAAALVEADA